MSATMDCSGVDRDLCGTLVRRDVSTAYAQTATSVQKNLLLPPAWKSVCKAWRESSRGSSRRSARCISEMQRQIEGLSVARCHGLQPDACTDITSVVLCSSTPA
ncbi:hypothetical protein DM02DRAFT_614913 [Periconia macrospinosa]|uniref:Uncharacterized protein n=1 Tax=Periconia macrospinosa TaxID=97972 RepID=A0A2V1DQL4_9PLEO|nr:hypothetical protein DM02DRAFT_614913 [Periconia macrospinosa]